MPVNVKAEVKAVPSEVFNVFKDSVLLVSKRKLETVAKKIAADLKERIYYQKFKHVPLSEKYLKWKKKKGLDTRILIATGEYVDSIMAKKLNDFTWKVGVPDKVHKGTKLPLKVLARIHEFGTSTIPARPHWRPVISIWKRKFRQTAKEIESLAIAETNRKMKSIGQRIVRK